MSRKPIENADDLIIPAAIKIGGNCSRGSFSTQDIATLAGVSEFVIFSRFNNKDNLIDTCNKKIYDRLVEIHTEVKNKYPTDSEKYFYGMLDAFLAEPEMTKFAGNYSLVFPRQNKADNYKVLFDWFNLNWKLFSNIAPHGTTTEKYQVVLFEIRELVHDALFILTGEIQDTPNNRKTMYLLSENGVQKFITLKN